MSSTEKSPPEVVYLTSTSTPRPTRSLHRSIRTSNSSRSGSRSRSRDPPIRYLQVNRPDLQSILLPATTLESVTASLPSTPSTEEKEIPFLRPQPHLLPSPFYPPTLSSDQIQTHKTPLLPTHYPELPLVKLEPEVSERDKGTPDDWVVRSDDLVRLTGRWPFNSEASLPDLYAAGFLTPTHLFYVRNHGIVPRVNQIEAINWSVEISGLVANPITLTLSDLLDPLQFSPITLPITLVCAGNRRKEQNVVRKSLGFSWGPAGLSTALFTGVYLADILDRVQPRNEGVVGEEGCRKAEFCVFEGAEDLPDGKYGTSQLVRWCRNRDKGMMIAWAMNGQALEPDHGYPLRLVVPGQIGGRSVKWLKKIIISDQESQHHLHFWDNKVLPTHLMPEQARAEREWWYDPRYIINDLNTNSAIARPAHDEVLSVHPSTADTPLQTYTLKGYAYGGGGRRITRVELTYDAGVTWSLAQINYPEDLYRKKAYKGDVWGAIDMTERDESYCWCFWEVEVEVAKLVKSGSVAVRAMDQGLSLQGQSMYWNPTGMMNNWWFRVAIHKTVVDGVITSLQFEHPTMPGVQPGGWMDRLKELGQDILNPIFTDPPNTEDLDILALSKEKAKVKKVVVSMIKEGVDRKITMEEVKAHNGEKEPWFIVNGEVYDGTGFLSLHPGGAESITIVAGEDASEDFMAIHSADAKIKLQEFHIGTLLPSTEVAVVASAEIALPDPIFLHKSKWKSAQLVTIDYINHDTRLYKFELEHLEQPLGLPTGQHVYARLRRKISPADAEAGLVEGGNGSLVEGDLVQRAYTPVSSSDAKGHLELLIKVYHRTADFPEGGRMTLGFEELEVGDKVEFKGPLGSFKWLGKGMANWRGVDRRVKKIGMICGGSGITPIIQVLRGVIHDVEDLETRLWLINANKTESDILLRTDLEDLETHVGPTRFQQHFCLSKAPEDWAHSRGRINFDMMEKHLPPLEDDTLILFCGPEPMLELIVKPGLLKMGWDLEKSLVCF